jgi:hypothetical protein
MAESRGEAERVVGRGDKASWRGGECRDGNEGEVEEEYQILISRRKKEADRWASFQLNTPLECRAKGCC